MAQSTLGRLKSAAFSAAKGAGLLVRVRDGRWRARRLLILGYHSVALEDEHEWNSAFSMPLSVFASRLAVLKAQRCCVLSLDQAVRLLQSGELPERSVVLTFDDGLYDFYRRAYPLLRNYGFPATVYLTTYYSEFNRPVFDVAVAYILWKARDKALPCGRLFPESAETILLATEAERRKAHTLIRGRAAGLSGEEKDALAAQLAALLGVDYAALCAKRILHLMNPAEVSEVSSGGIDIQLHTHRHRVPTSQELFSREIEDNRLVIAGITGRQPVHFCYPSGVYRSECLPWLAGLGVVSATTCEVGLASPASHPLLLPRLIDTTPLPSIQFEAWISGLAAVLPRSTGRAR